MKIRTCLFILVILAFSTAANAQIYKYKDASGNTHFTDDLSRVPVAQRPLQETVMPEVATPASEDTQARSEPEDTTTAEEATDAQPDSPYAIPGEETTEEQSPTDLGDWLATEQQALRNEYKSLLAEKEAIDKLRGQGQNLKEVNQRIVQNNQRVEKYQERLAVYNEKAAQYSQQSLKEQTPQAQ